MISTINWTLAWIVLMVLLKPTAQQQGIPVTTEDSQMYIPISDNLTTKPPPSYIDDYNETVEFLSPVNVPQWWCPPGYRLMNRVRVCSQKSCMIIGNDTMETCVPLSKEFLACHKILLASEQYRMTSEGLEIVSTMTNSSVSLGDFVLFNNVASVCETNNMSKVDKQSDARYSEELVNSLSPSCMPMKLSSNEFRTLDNGSALAFNDSKSFQPNFYKIGNNDSSSIVDACYELSQKILTCTQAKGHRDEFLELPNKDMFEVFEGGINQPLGDYMLMKDINDDSVVFCYEDTDGQKDRSAEKRYLYGIATAISAVFLFLALLAHMFFPNLNYHAMALLCHILSMLVMYVTLSINYLGQTSLWPPLACYILFAVAYVAALGAFFWLNVLAFDLWRVFAKMRGTFSPGNDPKKRIRFFTQCAYAWGIPSFMCILSLIIDNDKDIQDILGIPEKLTPMCWFTSKPGMMIFFYLPVIIILMLNVLFFGLTVINLRNASKGTDVLNKKVSRQLFRVFVKLFVVMGLFWFAEVFSWMFRVDDRYYYATDLINALQGVAIFLVYVCKESTWKVIRRRLGYDDASQATQSSSTSQVGKNQGHAVGGGNGGARRTPAMEMNDRVRTDISRPTTAAGGGGVQQNGFGKYSRTENVY